MCIIAGIPTIRWYTLYKFNLDFHLDLHLITFTISESDEYPVTGLQCIELPFEAICLASDLTKLAARMVHFLKFERSQIREKTFSEANVRRIMWLVSIPWSVFKERIKNSPNSNSDHLLSVEWTER